MDNNQKQPQKKANEQQQAAASYVLTFYQNVQMLTHNYANYYSLCLTMENEYPDVKKMPEEHRNKVLEFSNTVRYHAIMTYTSLTVIQKRLGLEINQELSKLHGLVENTLIIDRKTLKEYVNLMHFELSNNVMKDLLSTSESIINNIFGN